MYPSTAQQRSRYLIFQEMADADEDRRIDCKALCRYAVKLQGHCKKHQKARCLEKCLHFDITQMGKYKLNINILILNILDET